MIAPAATPMRTMLNAKLAWPKLQSLRTVHEVLGDSDPVCCAGYCGECTDYETCKSVRGQDSENACCHSAVHKMACGGGAAANVYA